MEPQRGDGTATVYHLHPRGRDRCYLRQPDFAEGDACRSWTRPSRSGRASTSRTTCRRASWRRQPAGGEPASPTRVPNPFVSRVRGLRWSTTAAACPSGASRSGGRMGQVMGEDGVEELHRRDHLDHQCQAQNRVRGQAVVLGFPFPVPRRASSNRALGERRLTFPAHRSRGGLGPAARPPTARGRARRARRTRRGGRARGARSASPGRGAVRSWPKSRRSVSR